MPSTSTPRRGRRGRSTPTQRDEADARHAEAAEAAIADPQTVRRRVHQAMAGMSRRILGFSLRNQMLLIGQAEERGINLTDVDTYRGWQRRGHQVRHGEKSLRIVRPVGREDEAKPDAETNDPHRAADTDAAEPPRIRFRFTGRFDISQTDPIDDFTHTGDEAETGSCPWCGAEADTPCMSGCTCPGCAGTPAAASQEPAEVAWNRIQEQIVEAGYRFDWPAAQSSLAGAQVRTDHDTRSVHVAMFADAADPQVVASLAVALAEIITRASRDRARRHAPSGAIEAAPVG